MTSFSGPSTARDPGARGQTMLNRLSIEILASFAGGMVDGASDAYESDTIGGTSINATYDAAGDYYYSAGLISDLVPKMTGASSPSGVASANAEDGGFPAWKAFDDDPATKFAKSSATSGWLRYQFAEAQTCTAYAIMGDGTQAPRDWTIRGSNNGTDWDDLDAQTGENPTTLTAYTFANETAYLYYEIVWTTNNGSTASGIFTLEFGTDDGPIMTLISGTATATVAPTSAQFLALYKDDSGSAVVGTDVTFELSRDGGTTWTEVTMTDRGAWVAPDAAEYRILDGVADISGQPSGVSMQYRIKTFNGKLQRIRGVARMWG